MIDATKIDPTQQEVQIQTNKPLLCSLPRCVEATRQISNAIPYMMLSNETGVIFFHLRCVGINPYGNVKDAAYVVHARKVIVDRFLGR